MSADKKKDDGISGPDREVERLLQLLAKGCVADVLFALGLRPASAAEISSLLKLARSAIDPAITDLINAGLVQEAEQHGIYEHAECVIAQLLGNRIRITIEIDNTQALILESPLG